MPPSKIESVFIANRGEIALRIARTLRQLGLRSVLGCHPIDLESPAARAVDRAVVLTGDDPIAAYLDSEQLIARAAEAGADALHPGYGFLAENADFAAAVAGAGLIFVGPSPDVIRLMGDKIAARAFVQKLGVAVSASATEEEEPATFNERLRALGLPLLIKASAGGGGKGMHVVREEAELAEAVDLARGEAQRYFGDPRLYGEPYIERPRHIEVQVLADHHGRVVHLFERECTLQRRFQKVVEESPARGLVAEIRAAMWQGAVAIAEAARYEGAGTVEFILTPDGGFTFLEMNTRLQVEHPVTEMVTGLDLVAEQIRIAGGAPLGFEQSDVTTSGHAIECRICAEDPAAGFRPSTGELLLLREPSGEGVRFDSGIAEGSRITPAFDPMLAKLIAHGDDPDAALAKARRALRDTVILGVDVNLDYLARVLGHPAFARAELHTGFLNEHAGDLLVEPDPDTCRDAVAAAALANRHFLESVRAVPSLHAAIGPWRN
jgi:propionyl-CoA carboxylase alpha chain/3-methylcrotonyl-CoA carboxylase alpha subunit/acetyl-CoA/propionyl-CoA carboxylase biotin carboxyl carrier protein